jgi:hypothetical protein
VIRQALHPAHRPGRRALGDLRLPLQPGPLGLLPVILMRAAGAERAQHLGMRRRIRRLDLRQLPQAPRLHHPRQVGGRHLIEEGQPSLHGIQRLLHRGWCTHGSHLLPGLARISKLCSSITEPTDKTVRAGRGRWVASQLPVAEPAQEVPGGFGRLLRHAFGHSRSGLPRRLASRCPREGHPCPDQAQRSSQLPAAQLTRSRDHPAVSPCTAGIVAWLPSRQICR